MFHIFAVLGVKWGCCSWEAFRRANLDHKGLSERIALCRASGAQGFCRACGGTCGFRVGLTVFGVCSRVSRRPFASHDDVLLVFFLSPNLGLRLVISTD